MNRPRIAVIGVGHLGQHHARILSENPEVELVGVVDSRQEQADDIAHKCRSRGLIDYRELLGKVDAVSIAVPTALHHEIGMAFLNQGAHCMIEKPLASKLSQAVDLVEAARKHGLVLQVGHIERFNPALAALENFEQNPRYIACERLGVFSGRSMDIGVVLDLMIHDLDLILSLTKSEVASVSAVGLKLTGEHEDMANARVEFKNGCVANLTASRVSYQTVRNMRLWADNGYAALDFAGKQGTVVKPVPNAKAIQANMRGVDLSNPQAIRDYVFGKILHVEEHQGQGPEPLRLELDEFTNAIRRKKPPTVTGEIALDAMKLADRVLTTIALHKWEPGVQGPPPPKFWTRRGVRANSHKQESS